ncbi:glycoside hydrolase family 75 protein [Streptomyces sp. NPDC002888]|uniref:glycoside hydrolase family 75 protein n=1 Tax=Streptomyces sp. NPDC002888 TaxID=3364668 RepID=UPI0036AC2625
MSVTSLTLAAAGLALLAQAGQHTTPHVPHEPVARHEGTVAAAELRARVRDCAPVSHGHYRSDADAPADISVCGTDGAVFWKADLDIDCDGRPGSRCNRRTDPWFSDATAYPQSDGRSLSAETLPYIVVPAPSPLWDHRKHGVRGGAVAAVVHGDRVQYAVVGDVGPAGVIGEASYATAEGLGLRADPRRGGAASGVTYIVFKDSKVTPIESHAAAVEAGERLAREFIEGTPEAGQRRRVVRPRTGPRPRAGSRR